MQAVVLVRISKKQTFGEISFKKISKCKKIGLGPKCTSSGLMEDQLRDPPPSNLFIPYCRDIRWVYEGLSFGLP